MIKLEMYAIRHIPTGEYLLMGPLQSGRGMTYRQPQEPQWFSLPRIFPNEQMARRSLRAWARGKYESSREDGSSYWTGKITKVPSRRIEEMEIVPITMVMP